MRAVVFEEQIKYLFERGAIGRRAQFFSLLPLRHPLRRLRCAGEFDFAIASGRSGSGSGKASDENATAVRINMAGDRPKFPTANIEACDLRYNSLAVPS